MTDPTDAESPSRRESPRSTAPMPRWVKVLLITAAVLVVLVVALMLASGGQHGPGRHLSSSGWFEGVLQVPLPKAFPGWRH
jgi:hypothetical protein